MSSRRSAGKTSRAPTLVLGLLVEHLPGRYFTHRQSHASRMPPLIPTGENVSSITYGSRCPRSTAACSCEDHEPRQPTVILLWVDNTGSPSACQPHRRRGASNRPPSHATSGTRLLRSLSIVLRSRWVAARKARPARSTAPGIDRPRRRRRAAPEQHGNLHEDKPLRVDRQLLEERRL